MNVLAIAAGCLIGVGLVLVVMEVRPAPPRLSTALNRLEGAEQVEVLSWRNQPGAWLAGRLPGGVRFGTPLADLDLVGVSADTFALKRIGYLVLGLAVPSLLNLVAGLAAGGALPWPVPAGAGVVLGVLFALTPDLAVRRQATELRREFRAALSTYLDLVALERAAGAGSSEALHAPADVCSGWVFAWINEVLQHAKSAGEQPWHGLAELGHQVGVAELTELADIAEDAGAVGASVLPTLLAKANSMRTTALADARARANSRTSEMPVAIAMSTGGFLLLVCFPAIYRLFMT